MARPKKNIQLKSEPKKDDVKEVKPSKKGYFIAQYCVDKNDYGKKYNVGDDVSHWDEERIKSAIESGYVNEQ